MILIDFEGIDGSGKSTLSQLLEKELIDCGIPTFHTRGNDELQSILSGEIRELSRNPNRLTMSAWTEALLYLARENQLLEEKILQYKDTNTVVITDRYFYSHYVLSSHVRGLDKTAVLELISNLSHGVVPDLVFLCDVDILTSQTRKSIQDAKDATYNDSGRKGLSGIALREKTREGFLKLASENPNWRVVDNMRSTLQEAYYAISSAVREQFGDRLDFSKIKPQCKPINTQSLESRHLGFTIGNRTCTFSEIEKSFYDTLATRSPDYQCFFLDSIGTDRSYSIRREFIPISPKMVAQSCKKLDDDQSLDILTKLRDICPAQVLFALTSAPPFKDASITIREHLAQSYPQETLYTLRGIDTDWAWNIRTRLAAANPRSLLLSLSRINTTQAWEIRFSLSSKKHTNDLLDSINSIETEDAWNIREKFLYSHPAYVLQSFAGIASPRAHEIRRLFMSKAPKLVASSLHMLTDPESWEIRSCCLNAYPQVLASIKHIDHPQADALRQKFIASSAHLVIDSLGMMYNSYSLTENPWIKKAWDANKNYFPFIKKIVEREDKRTRIYPV